MIVSIITKPIQYLLTFMQDNFFFFYAKKTEQQELNTL